jgi:hypothetical protein
MMELFLQKQLPALISTLTRKVLLLDRRQANALLLYAFQLINHHEPQFQCIIPKLFLYPFLIRSPYD